MSRQQGFSLLETMMALTLLALLLSAVMPVTDLVRRRAQESELRYNLQQIRQALDAYHQASKAGKIDSSLDRSGYPPDLNTLVDGVIDKTDPNGGKLYFLRRLPRDPFCESCTADNPAASWETRSYDSSPDGFGGGRDVFDIRSRSDKKGINGVPYKDW